MSPERRDDPNDEPQIARAAKRIAFGLAVLVAALGLGTAVWRLLR